MTTFTLEFDSLNELGADLIRSYCATVFTAPSLVDDCGGRWYELLYSLTPEQGEALEALLAAIDTLFVGVLIPMRYGPDDINPYKLFDN